MESTIEQVREKAKELFLNYGVRNVSMDDIAQYCGISKNTLYQLVAGKEALVHAVVEEMIGSHEELLQTVQATAKDAIDEVLLLNEGMHAICGNGWQGFLYQLEKFFSLPWKSVEQYQDRLYEIISGNLRRGKQEGLYREEIDIPLLADLRLRQVINVLTPGVLTSFQLTTTQLAKEFTLLYLHAITTRKGKEFLYRYVDKRRERPAVTPGKT